MVGKNMFVHPNSSHINRCTSHHVMAGRLVVWHSLSCCLVHMHCYGHVLLHNCMLGFGYTFACMSLVCHHTRCMPSLHQATADATDVWSTQGWMDCQCCGMDTGRGGGQDIMMGRVCLFYQSPRYNFIFRVHKQCFCNSTLHPLLHNNDNQEHTP